MSIFGQEGLEVQGLTSSQTVKAPVSTPSALEPIADIFGKVASLVTDDRDKKKKAKSEAALGDFMNKQMALADAVDQGKYTSAFARSISRKNFSEAANNNPALRKELIKIHQDILGSNGVGININKDSEQERLVKEQNSALVREGLANADSTESEFTIARNRLTASLEAKRKYELETQTLNLQKAKVGLTSSELDLLNKQEAAATLDYMAGISGSGYDSFKASMDNLVGQSAASGNSADALVAIENQFNAISTEFAIPLSKLTSTQATALMKPFELMKDIALKQASGELTNDAAKLQYDTALNLQKALAMKDPDIAKAAAISTIFSADPTVVKLSIENSVAKFMGTNSDTTTEETANIFSGEAKGAKGVKTYTDALNRVINNPKATPAMKAELATNLKKIVEGTQDYEGFVKKNPKSAIPLMDWIGSQGFAKAMRDNPESFRELEGMKEVVTQHYSNEVWGLVQSEIKSSGVTIEGSLEGLQFSQSGFSGRERPPHVGTSPATGLEDRTVNIPAANAVSFVVDADGTMKFVPIGTDPQLKNKAADLNKKLAPIINRTTKAMAHLEGRKDYQTFSMAAMEAITGDTGLKGKASEGDEALSVEDYREAPMMMNQAGKLSFLVDEKEGGGAYDTLFGFSQRGNGQFGGTDVSKMTLQEAVDFSSGSGKYGKWVKTKVGRIATPMGRYQIVGTTLRGLIKEMGLPMDTVFNKETQDSMFKVLIERRISGKSTMQGKIDALRKEWEGFKHVSDNDLMEAVLDYESSKE